MVSDEEISRIFAGMTVEQMMKESFQQGVLAGAEEGI